MDWFHLIQEQNSHSMNQDPKNSIMQSIEYGEEDPNTDISETPYNTANTEVNATRASPKNFLSSPSCNPTILPEMSLYPSEQDDDVSREPSPAFSEATTVAESRWTGLLRDVFILTFGYKIEQEDLNDETDQGDCITTVRELVDGQFPTRLIVIDLDPQTFEDGLWESGRQLLTSKLAEAVDEMKQVRGSKQMRKRRVKVGGILSIGEFSQFFHMYNKQDGLQEDLWLLGGKSLLHWKKDEDDIRRMLEYWCQRRLLNR